MKVGRGPLLRRNVSDAEYRRRYDLEVAQYITVMKEGTTSGINKLNSPLHWATLSDDASGYMTDHARLTTWWEYAARIRRAFGTSLKVIQPDGTWRKWAPDALSALDEQE